MNYISSFFIARYVFYLIFSSKLAYSFDLVSQLWKLDTFLSSCFSIVLAANFAKAKINIKRARRLILIPPFILLSPILLFIFTTLILHQWQDLYEILLNGVDFLFLLLSVSFSILVPMEILYSFKKPKNVYYYSAVSFILGVASLIMADDLSSGFVRMIPFLYGGYLVKKGG